MPFTILNNRKLSENVFKMDVEAPLVARSRKAGQFVIVSVDEDSGERIPLTISGADPEKGSIRLIYQRVGKATSQMAELKKGEAMGYIVGPLGKPTHIESFGSVVCVGGGRGQRFGQRSEGLLHHGGILGQRARSVHNRDRSIAKCSSGSCNVLAAHSAHIGR